MQKILLSFTGFHDPYSPEFSEPAVQPGPILTLVSEVGFDRVVLFRTPGMAESTDNTVEALRVTSPGLGVRVEDLDLPDPTDYKAIFHELRRVLRKVNQANGGMDVRYYIGLASGTPQMHSAWLLLVASGELPARILNTRPPKFVTDETSRVTEVDVHSAPFDLDFECDKESSPPKLGNRSIHFGLSDVAPIEELVGCRLESVVPRRPRVTEIDVYSEPFPAVRSYVPYTEEGSQPPGFAEAIADVGIVGEHPLLRKALERARIVAPTDYPVVILGETGTGKELLARLIHRLSGRPVNRFIPINCGAIPKDLVESTLFGHVKGAFTGAHQKQVGKFDAAHGGTLFLDELGEMPLEAQPKLLRALQDGIVEPLGAPRGHKVNVRVITSTNIDIDQAVNDGTLRKDLYYRLKQAVCHLPPLCQRRSDIPRLALKFLDQFNEQRNQSKWLSNRAMAWLRQQPWPGNIRELQNTIEAAALFSAGATIEPEDLEAAVEGSPGLDANIPEPADGFNMPQYLSELRRRLIERAMELGEGKQKRAAELLGISPQALNRYLQSKEDNQS